MYILIYIYIYIYQIIKNKSIIGYANRILGDMYICSQTHAIKIGWRRAQTPRSLASKSLISNFTGCNQANLQDVLWCNKIQQELMYLWRYSV